MSHGEQAARHVYLSEKGIILWEKDVKDKSTCKRERLKDRASLHFPVLTKNWQPALTEHKLH